MFEDMGYGTYLFFGLLTLVAVYVYFTMVSFSKNFSGALAYWQGS